MGDRDMDVVRSLMLIGMVICFMLMGGQINKLKAEQSKMIETQLRMQETLADCVEKNR